MVNCCLGGRFTFRLKLVPDHLVVPLYLALVGFQGEGRLLDAMKVAMTLFITPKTTLYINM